MDLLSMLVNAEVRDADGDIIGGVFAVHIAAGRMYLTLDSVGFGDGDPDGDKDDIPDDDASNKVQHIRAVGGENG